MAHHDIVITYSPEVKTVVFNVPPPAYRLGDTLSFSSSQGNVRVAFLQPEIFSVTEFRTGDDPVSIIGLGSYQYCCGVTVKGAQVGYAPDRSFGQQGQTDPPDGKG
jgi:hypothetical protein